MAGRTGNEMTLRAVSYLTKSSQSIDPTRDRFPGQSNAHVITEVIAILRNEMVRVSRVFFS